MVCSFLPLHPNYVVSIKRDALTLCRLNVDPLSATMAQYLTLSVRGPTLDV